MASSTTSRSWKRVRSWLSRSGFRLAQYRSPGLTHTSAPTCSPTVVYDLSLRGLLPRQDQQVESVEDQEGQGPSKRARAEGETIAMTK